MDEETASKLPRTILIQYVQSKHQSEFKTSLCIFQKSGPTKQQMEESFFEYFFYGRGWETGENVDEQNPTKKVWSGNRFLLILSVFRH